MKIKPLCKSTSTPLLISSSVSEKFAVEQASNKGVQPSFKIWFTFIPEGKKILLKLLLYFSKKFTCV